MEEGGVTCPKPMPPFGWFLLLSLSTACIILSPDSYFAAASFPEHHDVRDPRSDPLLRPSTDPVEPEASLLPSKGWVDGVLPDSIRNYQLKKFK